MVVKTCPICGDPLGRNKNACSMACYAELKQNYKVCVVCKVEFPCPPSTPNVTCGRATCSQEHRRNLYKEGRNIGLKVAHKKLPRRPLTGRFETHMHAKKWVIQSPDGVVYKCRNLKNWLRENEHMLDGTVEQAWDGISKIKYSMQGKRERAVSQWKGWQLLDWED